MISSFEAFKISSLSFVSRFKFSSFSGFQFQDFRYYNYSPFQFPSFKLQVLISSFKLEDPKYGATPNAPSSKLVGGVSKNGRVRGVGGAPLGRFQGSRFQDFKFQA